MNAFFVAVLFCLSAAGCHCCQAGDFIVETMVSFDSSRESATSNITISKDEICSGYNITVQLREVGGGDERDGSCSRLLAGSHDPGTTLVNFTCSHLGLGKAFEVVIGGGDLQNEEIHHFLYTTSVQSVYAHHTPGSSSSDGSAIIRCSFARGSLPPSSSFRPRGCKVELVDLNETADPERGARSLTIPRDGGSRRTVSGTVAGLEGGHYYSVTGRDWFQTGGFSAVKVPGEVLHVGEATAPGRQGYTIYCAAGVGSVLVLTCVAVAVCLLVWRGKRQRTYTVTKTSVTTHQRTRHVQPSYENVASSRYKAYENFLSPNHTGSEPPYNNVFPMQESCSTLKSQPAARLLPQYQNVNPRTSQLKANNSESPISSSIGHSYPSSSSTPGHSISTCATESTGISSLAVHASFSADDGIFDNAEDFTSTAPSCSTSQQSNPSYTNVFTVTSSLDDLSNVSMGSSLSSEEPPPSLPPHTDEMLQETEAAEEPNTGSVNSSGAGHRLVADGDEIENETAKPNTAQHAEGSSEIDGQSSVMSRPQTPGTPPPVPEHTLRMYCQRLDPNNPTAQPDPDWVMRPPPLIPKYSKQMHQLTDTLDAEEKDTARNQTPQTVSKPVPVPPPIEEEILLAVMQFKRLQREGKLEFEPVTEEDSCTVRDDKMTLGEFLGHNYEDVGPGHPRQRSYLQYRSDLRPSSSHAPYEPTDNDPYHFVYNLAYVLKRRSN